MSNQFQHKAAGTKNTLRVVLGVAIVAIIIAVVAWARIPAPALASSDVSSDGVFLSRGDTSLSEKGKSENYYRGLMTEEAVRDYDAIENGLRNFDEEIRLPHPASTEQAVDLLYYVVEDNPDIFWLEPDFSIVSEGEDNVVAIMPYYAYSKEAAEETAAELEAEIAVFSFEPGYVRDYGEKDMEVISNWIADRCEYGDHDSSPDMQNIDSVFIDGESVCAGYSKAACVLARKNDINAVLVYGSAIRSNGKSGEHEWIAFYDSASQQVLYSDVTWFDGDEHPDKPQWLGVELGEFSETHVAARTELLPTA